MPKKSLTLEEGGFAAFTGLIALYCLIAAAKTTDAVMAFHAWVGLALSLVGIFAIFKGYANRKENPPQTIDGLPNYQLGPVKFASFMAMFWGIAGFTVGLVLALQLAYPALNFDLPWTNFGRLRP